MGFTLGTKELLLTIILSGIGAMWYLATTLATLHTNSKSALDDTRYTRSKLDKMSNQVLDIAIDNNSQNLRLVNLEEKLEDAKNKNALNSYNALYSPRLYHE